MSEQIPYTPPEFGKGAFHCPHCGVYSKQEWKSTGALDLRGTTSTLPIIKGLQVAYCQYCIDAQSSREMGDAYTYTVWHLNRMIYPEDIGIPPPNADLREDIQKDYQEAGAIVNKSPRGAAALLRLCIQKLCNQLGEKGRDINTDIGNLVQKGLPQEIQKALDVVRVIGNSAVHAGQIDIQDDRDIAISLFLLVNRITDVMITSVKRIETLYDMLPQTIRDKIQKRDQY
jgi:hypothetical protein